MKTIDQVLVDDAHRRIEDNGFTARVMGALPAPAPRSAQWWKPLLMVGSTALGCALAAFFAPSDSSVLQGAVDLATAHYATPGALMLLGLTFSVAVAGAVLALED